MDGYCLIDWGLSKKPVTPSFPCLPNEQPRDSVFLNTSRTFPISLAKNRNRPKRQNHESSHCLHWEGICVCHCRYTPVPTLSQHIHETFWGNVPRLPRGSRPGPLGQRCDSVLEHKPSCVKPSTTKINEYINKCWLGPPWVLNTGWVIVLNYYKPIQPGQPLCHLIHRTYANSHSCGKKNLSKPDLTWSAVRGI